MCQKARLQNAKHNVTTPTSTAGPLANSGSQNTHAQPLRREVTIDRAKRAIAANKLKRPSTQVPSRQVATASHQANRAHTQHFRDLNHRLAPLERDSQDTDEAEANPVETPSGPFALNSAHGVQAIRKVVPKTVTHPLVDTSATAARFMGKKPPKPPKVIIKKKAHSCLPIVASDLQLYKWRQQGLPWSKVGEQYEQLPETTFHSEDRMRKRFRFVEESIETEEISEDLCQRVIDGEEGAEEELNRLVGLKAPEKAAPLDTRPFRKITKGDAADAKPVVAASHASTPHPQTLVAPRPTQGGKTIDYESSQIYFAHVAELLKEDAETEAEDTYRESSPITDQDTVHWEYFLERRDFDVDELNEELMENEIDSVEDMEWREYGVTRAKLWDANALASSFVLATPEGSQVFTGAQNFSLSQERDENGMVLLTRTSDSGTTQVRVCRRLLTFQQHIVPESKDGWLPKVMYCVQVKIINKPQDDLFDSLDITLKTLDDEIYGSLEQANSCAIAEWVKLTLKPTSARLKQVEIELAEARAALLRDLEDEGEDPIFRRSVDDDEKSVEVFVQMVKVKGPRN